MEGKRQTRRAGYSLVGGSIAVIAITLALQARSERVTTTEIRTTSYGVPHVLAADFAGAGYGLGYAFAQSNICEIADRWITVNAQRSKYFGPDAMSEQKSHTNLTSDFHWARILDMDIVGRELQQPPPVGPTADVRDLIRGYVAGYNTYLAEVGVDKIPDPRCRGKEWVRPITEMDVYLRALHWNMWDTDSLVDEIVAAQPPTGRVARVSSPAMPLERHLGPMTLVPELSGPGSNMIALGREATDNGKGMLFANPHWYWHGPERWWEFQMTVPGRVNVNGAGILGIPIVLFGHTEKVAWSHTYSTPGRHSIYELKLAPDSPTSYLYEGQVRTMTPRAVTVDVKEADGRLTKRGHTFWETHYGPALQSETYVWTKEKAFAFRDVLYSFRWLNQQLEMNQANSVEELDAAGRKYLGIGWLNTIAADAAGNTLYADRTAIPYVTDEMVARCGTGTKDRWDELPALDGSRSACEWGNEAGTPIPGILPVSKLPMLARADYVTNSNNSHWTNNLRQRLEGFPRVIGEERTARSLRTRIGLLKIERRLNGTDGNAGKRFTLEQLEAITMDNRLLAGELWRDSLVSYCRTMPAQKGIPDACNVLAAWDLTQNPGSSGGLLFRRFFENLFPRGAFGPVGEDVYTVPFDANDPMNTPRGLNTANPKVAQALTAATNDLLGSGIPLNAKYGDYHFVERNGTKIAIPGGDAGPGQYNLIGARGGWQAGRGYTEVRSGSSYMMWMQFTDKGPVGRSIMTYSQSANPSSPNYSDQTKLFSQKKSKPMLFDEAAIKADPNLKVTKLSVRLAEDESR
jgi:acyl-homoserine-lactone acylase